jgi:orotate phosphoribosyltransferase
MFEDIRIEGDFLLSSGKRSKYYYDFERLTPGKIRKYGKQLIQTFGFYEYKFPFVATAAYGGIPLAFSIACDLDVPLIIIEKSDEIRGDVGILCNNYLIVDDVISSYNEIERVQKILRCEAGAATAFIFRGDELDPHLTTWFLEKKELEF